MTEQPASQGATTAPPPQSAKATARQVPAASPPRSGQMHTRISGMPTSLMAAGTARMTQLRHILRHDRRKPDAS
jgi:hypothetical protein